MATDNDESFPENLLGAISSPSRDLARAAWLPMYMQDVPAGPPTCQRTTGYTTWGVKGNNRYGCCVVSGAVHNKQAVSYVDAEGPVLDIPDADLIRVYLQLSPRDNGLVISEFLKWQTKQPKPWKIDAYGATDPKSPDEMKKCVWWLGGVTLGIGVPSQWRSVSGDGFVWDRTGYFRGVTHDVVAVDYNERGLEIITWGKRGTITWAGLAEQCGEAWAMLPPEWYGQDSKSPPGLDVHGLRSYLAYITGQPDPNPLPTPPPIPVPPTPIPPTPTPPTPPNPDPGDALARRWMSMVGRGISLYEAGHAELVKSGIELLEQKWGHR